MAVGIRPDVVQQIGDKIDQAQNLGPSAEIKDIVERLREEGLSEDVIWDAQRALIRALRTGSLTQEAIDEILRRYRHKYGTFDEKVTERVRDRVNKARERQWKEMIERDRATARERRAADTSPRMSQLGLTALSKMARAGTGVGAGILASTIGQDMIKDYYQGEVDRIESEGIVTPETEAQLRRNAVFANEERYAGSDTPYYTSPIFNKYR